MLTKLLFAVIAFCFVTLAQAQPLISGFLCCNMRSDAKGWITDINYEESGKHVVPAGTPANMTGYGRNRFEFDVTGNLPRKNYWIGNDYSRKLSMEQFAARYIVKADPNAKMAGFAPKIREAIRGQKIVLGMTKEQVLMSLGYPSGDETPNLDGPWKFYLWSFSPFTLNFTNGKLASINTDPDTKAKVLRK
jgi:hypothetical protein